jgi:hypothetical protein
MKRCLGWSLLLMAGILLGVASSSYQTTHADDPPAEQAADDTPTNSKDVNAAILAELKKIRGELKEVNSYLRTGVVKTTAVFDQSR